MPSTSIRTSPSYRSTTAETRPRLSVRAIAGAVDERERHLDHAVEVLDRDPLVGRVDVLHPVREVEALQAALVEDVCVRRTAAEPVARGVPGALERGVRQPHDLVVTLESVTAVALVHLRLD